MALEPLVGGITNPGTLAAHNDFLRRALWEACGSHLRDITLNALLHNQLYFDAQRNQPTQPESRNHYPNRYWATNLLIGLWIVKDDTLLALFLGNTHSDTHPAVPATTGALHSRQQFPRTFTVFVTLVSLLMIICSVIKQRSSRLRLYSPPQQRLCKPGMEKAVSAVPILPRIDSLRTRWHFTLITVSPHLGQTRQSPIGTTVIKCSVSSPGCWLLSDLAVLIVCDYALIGFTP